MIKINNNIILFSIVLAIIFFGFFLMYSASSSFANYRFNKADTYFLSKHFIWLLIGLLAMVFLLLTNHYLFKKYAKIILFLSWGIMLIPILLNFGESSIDRWLKIGNFTLMTTSDFSKLAAIIFISMFIDRHHQKINDLKFLFKNLFPYLFITIGLILYQPDLSTSIILCSIIFCLLYIAGINKKIILLLSGTSLLCLSIILSIFSYQRERLFSWIGMSELNNQSSNSILALANGGFTGTGIGQSIFKYNGFIPEGQTDFILAIIGEELGFLGIFIIFLLFTILFIKGLTISKNCSDRFSMFLSIGIIINIFFYLIINSAYVVGILPTTGLPIPFISYGGSQTIFSLISIGILMSISKNNFNHYNRKYYYETV
tara:strand:+ start:251 stop:1369 length:1119 start_codon:yes stop_codon:yes gene_type:complete